MEDVFQVRDFIQIFKKRFKVMFFVPLLFAAIGASISFFLIAPVYEARSDLLVNNTVSTTEDQISVTDIETNLRLIETYQFIILSDRIIDSVVEELGNSVTNKELKEQLRVEINDNSQIVSLYVKASNPELAVNLVNSFAATAKTEITDLMNIENINILTEAKVEKHMIPIHPKPIIYAMLSFMIGFLICGVYVFLDAYFNTKIGSKEDVEKYLGLPLLGEVGIISKPRNKQRRNDVQENLVPMNLSRTDSLIMPIIEAYRTIRTNLQFLLDAKSLKTILITSATKDEGKTITSKNLALITALDQKKTVVIDSDLRKEKIGKLDGQIGLTNYLGGSSSIEEIIKDTKTPNLKTISCGPIPPNPAEILSSEHMNELLRKLKDHFDRIIIDSPPLFFADASILATKVDGCLVVVQSDKTKVTQIKQGVEQLANVEATVLGVVLNKKKQRKKTMKYYHYGTR